MVEKHIPSPKQERLSWVIIVPGPIFFRVTTLLRMRLTEHTLQVLFDGCLVALTAMLAIVAIKQAQATRKAVKLAGQANQVAAHAAKMAKESNQIAMQNSHADLRAYVSLGDKSGKWMTVTAKDTISLFFFNAGRTPARHLVDNFSVGQTGAPAEASKVTITHIERFEIVEGPFKGARITTTAGSELSGREVLQLEQKKAGVDFTKHDWNMTGYFEYCDIFGQWHCDAFSYHPSTNSKTPWRMPSEMFCDLHYSPYLAQVRAEQGPDAAKQYKALDRCEQGD
jgi:hypothetical protein